MRDYIIIKRNFSIGQRERARVNIITINFSKSHRERERANHNVQHFGKG